MIRFLLLITGLGAGFNSFGQGLGLCHQVIGATGGSTTESGLHYSYTVGEVAIFTLQKPGVNTVLTQGFHQPDVCLPVSTHQPELWADWSVQAYPNPASDFINLQISAPDDAAAQVQVLNVLGQTMYPLAEVRNGGTRLDCSSWNVGLYYILLTNTENQAVLSIPFTKIY